MDLTLILLIVYGIVAIVVARVVAGHLAYESSFSSEPEIDDWFLGGVGGMFAGGLWPICVIALLLYKLPFRAGAEREGRARQREDDIRRREAAVRRAEQELGL